MIFLEALLIDLLSFITEKNQFIEREVGRRKEEERDFWQRY